MLKCARSYLMISSLLVLISLLMLPGASDALVIRYVGEGGSIQSILNNMNMNPPAYPPADSDFTPGNRSFDNGTWGSGTPRPWNPSPYSTLEIRVGWDHGLPEKFVLEESEISFRPQLFYRTPDSGTSITYVSKSNKTLRIIGHPDRGAVIRSEGSNLIFADWRNRLHSISGFRIVFENIIFEGKPGGALQTVVEGEGMAMSPSTLEYTDSTIEFINCEFRDVTGTAVLSRGRVEAIDTTISRVGKGIEAHGAVTLDNVSISEATDTALHMVRGGSSVENSSITDSIVGIYIEGPGSPTHNIVGNEIEGNFTGLYISTDIWDPAINVMRNSFAGNIDYGMFNRALGLEFEAAENYWGHESGPGGAGPGAGAAVGEYINYTPWYVDPGMTQLSDGTDPSPDPDPDMGPDPGTGVQPPPVGPRPEATTQGPGAASGCFIATSAFGSYDAPEVVVLRNFRDGFLLRSPAGSSIVSAYYRLSPPVADFLESCRPLRAAAGLHLKPVAALISLFSER